MRKKFSIKGLADYMTATPSRQRTIIRQYKYPQEDEGRAKIHYYREARDLIAAYHTAGKRRAWIEGEALRLDSIAAYSNRWSKARLENNARAVRAYSKHFGGRDFVVLDDLNLGLEYGDVLVTVRPDLHVIEKDKEKIIKLEFATKAPDPLMVKIIAQGMFEAAIEEGMDLKSAQVLYLDVLSGKEHKGARLGARMRKDMAAACDTISDIWPSI